MNLRATMDRDWPPEELQRLRDLWAEGYSFAQIGVLLGRTKNSIAGKKTRLKLPNPDKKIKPEPKAAKPKRANAPKRAAIALPAPILIRVPEPIKLRAKLHELHERSCRWPFGDPKSPDFCYCGAEKPAEASYCAEHARNAYQAARANLNPKPIKALR